MVENDGRVEQANLQTRTEYEGGGEGGCGERERYHTR